MSGARCTRRWASATSTCSCPTACRVVVDGHSGAGSVSVFGRRSETCCPTDVRRVRPGVANGGSLHLDAEVGAGTVEIKP